MLLCLFYKTILMSPSDLLQLSLRNLCKPLIWVSCFYEVLSLHLDFPSIVFNTLVIARLILPLIVDEQLHKNFVLLNKIILLICNLHTINCSHFKGRDQWILTNMEPPPYFRHPQKFSCASSLSTSLLDPLTQTTTDLHSSIVDSVCLF